MTFSLRDDAADQKMAAIHERFSFRKWNMLLRQAIADMSSVVSVDMSKVKVEIHRIQ